MSTVSAVSRAVLFVGLVAALHGARADAEPPDREAPAAGAAADAFRDTVRPLLRTYCFGCHGETNPEGELSLAAFRTGDDVLEDRQTWQRVWQAVRSHKMPPEQPLPAADERQKLVEAIAGLLRQAGDGRPRPGQVVLRRLNQVEYNNTVLDLFGVFRSTHYYNPERGMPEEVRVVLHREYRRTVVTLPPDDVGYGFTNIGETLSLPPFLLEKYFAAARQVVEQLGREGRFRGRRDVRRPGGDPDEQARAVLADFGRRAFRRPLSSDELDRYTALYQLAVDRGETFEAALNVPVQAMLVSPHFLFKVEHGRAAEEQDGVRPLDDHELATRLSYFLWSTMPDEELFRLAGEGRLRDAGALERQARRMLRHRFSKELSEQFGLQWLGLTGIQSAMPFPDLFPEFYRLQYLPEAMRMEALLLFETIVVEDRSVLGFLDPGFAWLNGTLNGFYDVDPERAGVRNSRLFWHRYDLPDKRRGGILTMGGPLLATSLATRTSPVKRGQWVLENVLGSPAPPPPPEVAELEETPPADEQLRLRERLERHRADAACAACHQRMDPLGFALENYNAIGAWRDRHGSEPIDATGTLVDGTTVNGPVELKELLVTKHRDEFLRCLTERMLTYALGRRLEFDDAPAIEKIVERLKEDDHRFSALVAGIVRSEPFRYRQVTQTASSATSDPATPDERSRR